MVDGDGNGDDVEKTTLCWHRDYEDMLDKASRQTITATATAGVVAQRGSEVGGGKLAGYLGLGLGRLHRA